MRGAARRGAHLVTGAGAPRAVTSNTPMCSSGQGARARRQEQQGRSFFLVSTGWLIPEFGQKGPRARIPTGRAHHGPGIPGEQCTHVHSSGQGARARRQERQHEPYDIRITKFTIIRMS